jgi:L-cysteine S-thiosulfotransferase
MRIATTRVLTLAGFALSLFALPIGASADENWGKYENGDRRSGYTYAAAETRAMQDDDFSNPASIWLDQGEGMWSQKEGDAGKACSSCHSDAAKTMKGVGTVYPKYDFKTKKMMGLEQRINRCRTDNMKAKAWKYDSSQMLSTMIYVRNQSKDMAMNVAVDGHAAPFFEKGKAFFNQRRGQLDMSCKNCHEDNAGNLARANVLSEGQSNGFPTYRLKWQKPGSIHRRFRGCNKNVRATPYKTGADDYNNLELYVAWRGRGLPVETPSVRN